MAQFEASDPLADMADRYRLHPETIEFFVGERLRRSKVEASTVADLKACFPPVIFNQTIYNLMHVERGERLHSLAAKRLQAGTAPSVLDIGCGIGGTLIAFGRNGFTLHGIELSEARRRLCTNNLSHNGLSAELLSVDLCAEGLTGRRFNVIICNSVIEHVEDPTAMIRRFTDLLLPGGVLVFGIANPEALGNVIADPHYGVFGLTLLPPGPDRRLFEKLASVRQAYSVTEFWRIDRYADAIAAAVGPVEKISPEDDKRGMEAVPDLLARTATCYQETLNSPALRDDPDLRQALIFAYSDYLSQVSSEYRRAVTTKTSSYFCDSFVRKSFQLVATMRH